MIEANRLSVPGEHGARTRVEAVYAAADRLTPDDLQLLPVPPRDLEEREVLLADLERVTDARGRGALLDEARGWLRDALLTRVVSRYRPESGVAAQPAGGSAEDQARIFMALEDAVSVAVAVDLLEPEAAAILGNPGRRILGLEPLPGPGEAGAVRPPVAGAPWAPSARDWSEADRGAAVIDADAPLPGVRAFRVLPFGLLAILGVVTALAWGFSQDEPSLGALAALAVVVVAWTFATFRRAR